MKKRVIIPLAIFAVLLLTYFLGPPPPDPVYKNDLPEIPASFSELGSMIDGKEASQFIRKDNQARIRWYEDERKRTEYVIVYLHGFGGSYRDGYPVNAWIADSLSANSFFARWGDHGLIAEHALENFSAELAWKDAKEALAIGKQIGEKVIVMSTSTGGTLGLMLAANFPEDVYALVNLGPNIEDDMPGAWLLNTRWGYEIATLVSMGNKRKVKHEESEAAQYFDTIYPPEALVDLQVLVGTTMLPETFKKIKCPVQTLYFHKDETTEDEHVEVSMYPEVHDQFATPADKVELVPLPNAGSHFVGSEIKAKDLDRARQEILDFIARIE